MNINEKPQDERLGQISNLDTQSINRNANASDSTNPNYRYLFGKSSPIITDYDIAEQDLFPDAQFCNAMLAADKHLRSIGLIPCWSREDQTRLHRYQWQLASWSDYRGAK